MSNSFLIDAATRHAVFVNRFGGGQSKEAQKLLKELQDEILARLAQEPTQFRRERLTSLLDEISGLTTESFQQFKETAVQNAQAFAEQEVEFAGEMIEKVIKDGIEVNLPNSDVINGIILNTPMDAKLAGSKTTIQGALDQFGIKKTQEILQTIRDGVLLGDTTPEISAKVKELVNFKQRRQIDSLARTIINQASSTARNSLYAENEDILEGYEWVSTLDNHTSLICGGRDGKIFQQGGPLPPAHWSCRSTTIPRVNPAFTIAKLQGKRAAKGDQVGPINAQSTYGGWLRKQSKPFQEEALGIERTKLFRSGKFTIDDFTDPTGRTYTLEELRAQRELAFN